MKFYDNFEQEFELNSTAKSLYHIGSGNANESHSELPMMKVPKLIINFGSIINCTVIFTITMKMSSLNFSTCSMLFKKNLFDFEYLLPKRFEISFKLSIEVEIFCHWLTCIDEVFNIIDTFKYCCLAKNNGRKTYTHHNTTTGCTNAFHTFHEITGHIKNIHNM